MSPEGIALLRAIAADVAAIRAAVERPPATFDRQAELLSSIEDQFGRGCPFTVSGLLTLADEESYGRLAATLARVIDLSAAGRAVSLGRLLGSIDALERSPRGGVMLYRLPDGD